MARKSKRNKACETIESKNIYSVGVYVRLSVYDDEKDSESLCNQRELVCDYIKKKDNMKIYDIYCDKGKTGTNFDRDEFRRMMDDIYAGRINCVAVKDLSRFGREYIETGEYLEKLFPLIGVRFIAVNDGYDNYISPFDMSVSIKNIFNTMYARDISRKTSAAIRAKQGKGEYIGAVAPYGYVKSDHDKHKLIMDKDAAVVVKRIFIWRYEGMGYTEISRILQDIAIPTPSRYKYDSGVLKSDAYKNIQYWRPETVKAILKNEIYTGSITVGLGTCSNNYDIGESLKITERSAAKNTHEPIISEEIFDYVQSMSENGKNNHKTKMRDSSAENLFKSKIMCGSCAKGLTRYKSRNGEKLTCFYVCRRHWQYPKTCDFVSVNEERLKDIVITVIKKQLECFADNSKVESALKNSSVFKRKMQCMHNDINMAQYEREYDRSDRIQVMIDYTNGILSEEEYRKKTEEIKDRSHKAEQKLKAAESEIKKITELADIRRTICENMCCDIYSFIDNFIGMITLYADDLIQIKLNFSDKTACLTQY